MLACETVLDRMFLPSFHGGHNLSDHSVVLTLGMLFLEDQLCESRTIAKTIGP